MATKQDTVRVSAAEKAKEDAFWRLAFCAAVQSCKFLYAQSAAEEADRAVEEAKKRGRL